MILTTAPGARSCKNCIPAITDEETEAGDNHPEKLLLLKISVSTPHALAQNSSSYPLPRPCAKHISCCPINSVRLLYPFHRPGNPGPWGLKGLPKNGGGYGCKHSTRHSLCFPNESSCSALVLLTVWCGWARAPHPLQGARSPHLVKL